MYKHQFTARGFFVIVMCIFVGLNLQAQTTNYTPLFTSSNFTKTIDLSKPVGAIKGAADVTSSGGASYTIPIDLPVGTNGMAPTLSLVYNSQAGNGIAGYGWSISGFSAISRTPRNFHFDGFASPVTLTNQDHFVLDGQRMIPIIGNNGEDQTLYETEMQNWARIISYGDVINSLNTNTNAPEWFEIELKDGTKMEFGNSPDSRIIKPDLNLSAYEMVLGWRINKMTDIYGNYIEFKYEAEQISEILYTKNSTAGIDHFIKVVFSYKERLDGNSHYENGPCLFSNKLLDKITIQPNSAQGVIKEYKLNYGFDNLYSLLKEIIESGVGGEQLNSTIFLYGEAPQNTLSINNVWDFPNTDMITADFDADGKTDLLTAEFQVDQYNLRHHVFIDLWKNLDQSTSTSMQPIYWEQLTGNNLAYQSLGGGYTTQKYSRDSYLASDYDGDSRDDVIFLNTYTLSSGSSTRLSGVTINYTKDLIPNTAYHDFNKVHYPSPYYTGEHGQYMFIHQKGNFFFPGDFDGDGSQDFITILGNISNYRAFFTSPTRGIINQPINNFGCGTNNYGAYYAVTVAEADNVMPIDIDGDSKTELLVIKGNNSYIVRLTRYAAWPNIINANATGVGSDGYQLTNNTKLLSGDFNGDGKTDLLIRVNSIGSWFLKISNGKSFHEAPVSFNQTVATDVNTPGSQHKIIIADFNGDGKSDIMHGFDQSNVGKLSVYFSSGVSVTTGGYAFAAQFHYEQFTLPNALEQTEPMVGDFNGDGRADIINWASHLTQLIYIKPNSKERLLVKVTDGFNRTTEFNYASLPQDDQVYQKVTSLDDPSNSYPFNYSTPAIYCVSSVTTPNGVGGTNTIDYNYTDAILHRQGKGFLGFKKRKVINDVTEITTTSENELNSTYALLLNKKNYIEFVSPTYQTQETIEETEIFSTAVGNAQAIKQYFIKINKILNVDHLNGRATETINDYDNYGNISQSINKIGILNGNSVNPVETTTTLSDYSAIATFVPARLTATEIYRTRDGSMGSNKITYSYTAAGILSAMTEFDGTPGAITTTYTHDAAGNVLSSVVSASGLNSRTTEFIYDATKRFIIQKKQIASGIYNSEHTEYHPWFGKPTLKFANDCNHTSFEYDGFGRNTFTAFSDGTVLTASLEWNVGNNRLYNHSLVHSANVPDKIITYDKLEREIIVHEESFNGNWVTRNIGYDAKGNKITETNNHLALSETPLVTTTTYGKYNRPIETNNQLSAVHISYSNLAGGVQKITKQAASGIITHSYVDASGKIIMSEDEGGLLEFKYDYHGNQIEIKQGACVLITKIYDEYNRLIEVTEINSGTTVTAYDAYGQLIYQEDAKGNAYNFTYDDIGRLIGRHGGEGITEYLYANTGDDCYNNKLTDVIFESGVARHYVYNNLGQLQEENSVIDGNTYSTQYLYTHDGKVSEVKYPSGFTVAYSYDGAGYITQIDAGDAGSLVPVFMASQANGTGQYTDYTLGNGLNTLKTFDFGIPVQYSTPGVFQLDLGYNYSTGNVDSKDDHQRGLDEQFEFDGLNRLIQSYVNGNNQLTCEYDNDGGISKGNITTKTDVGNYVYSDNRVHAVRYVDNAPGNVSQEQQAITYTSFLSPETIVEGTQELQFTYGPEYFRVKTELFANGTLEEKKIFLGDYEILEKNGHTYEIHYISAGNDLIAMAVRTDGGETEFFYTYTDNLGSIQTVTDNVGEIIHEQSFDPWGRFRDPYTGDVDGYTADLPDWLYRGFTGHEHLLSFGLINMNARLYDPLLARMLGPDKHVSDPSNTQAYNKYSYALNNPVSYIDPDGNFPVVAVAVGAVIGSYIGGSTANGTLNIAKWNFQSFRTWGYMLGGAAFGGFSGYLGATIAASGMPMANTVGIASASLMNNIGTHLYTGGQTEMSISLGIASYNFDSREWGYIGKKGNSTLENLAYGFGALANLVDVVSAFSGGGQNVSANSAKITKEDWWGHHSLTAEDGSTLVSVGPESTVEVSNPVTGTKHSLSQVYKNSIKGAKLDWDSYVNEQSTWKIQINNVSKSILSKYSTGRWDLIFNSCTSHSAKALWMAGVPNLFGFHPHLLNTQLLIRQIGISASPYLYNKR